MQSMKKSIKRPRGQKIKPSLKKQRAIRSVMKKTGWTRAVTVKAMEKAKKEFRKDFNCDLRGMKTGQEDKL